ncbi:ATP-binding protein [Saccharicrinis fermentans]|uniref:ATP-binding protein n=1 Tax=Saccharicrinis fermentans TaxID=982 RepID=UPI0004B51F16|nr:ATP-binding protein [Saccharicrinis fermentans]
MKLLDQIKNYADILRLTRMKNEPEAVLHQAQIDKPSYQEFALQLLQREVQHRKKTDLDRRMKLARLPKDHNLDKYDFNMANGMTVPQLKQLRELLCMEQNYNLILMGPSGTGKTYVAAGLINDAVKSGHKAYFITMEELITVLKMKEMISGALKHL